ncbi:HTH-type transcriptional regulator AcrR [Anaerotignum neopropionicum]|uniref:HTH-type transcriptional regulator AcrR n=1 Tax=Anaerotignum neopropionicum TaxID=36847 RepID=A0A136WB14_9FIRM|nr:TetR/AcrR family transcriptional regulator [Anaerotignum neopropionicum]KXL51707.1 HTH-type transcriptional regulator AcrR [Anaerotignum neopropionicum]
MAESKRKIQKELTRKHILDTAIKKFGHNGFVKTRTLDIATAANISHGSLFAHFPTMDDLMTSAIEEFGNRLCTRLHDEVSKKQSLPDILQAHLNGILDFEDFYTHLIIERRLLPESAKNTYIVIQSTISFHIGLAAEKEIQQGKIKNMPLHMLFNAWMGMIHYYLSNGDLFQQNGSIIKAYGPELLANYLLFIKST